jgi:hypothetical protein
MPRILDDENHQDLVSIGVGAWQPFPADPGWDSTLRYRRVPAGLQLEGHAYGPMPANALGRIGVLPPPFRPLRRQCCAIVVFKAPGAFTPGAIVVDADGGVWTYWPVAGSTSDGAEISVIIVLD